MSSSSPSRTETRRAARGAARSAGAHDRRRQRGGQPGARHASGNGSRRSATPPSSTPSSATTPSARPGRGCRTASPRSARRPHRAPSGPTVRPRRRQGSGRRVEPLAYLQWDMDDDRRHADGAHRQATGSGVTVGIIDTGVDASHPDIAPNFDHRLSRNFTMDIPAIDGPCDMPTCIDPADVDDGGHGTHVAGTVAAARNGIGITGVAPDATIVNVRAGQDSGYFFVCETVAALTYAGDAGLDVVNMSFYTDPWLYNCDSRDDYLCGDVTDAEIAEQAIIRSTVLAAIEYAHDHGVTLVAAAGNGHTNLALPTRFDATSPDYPPGTERRAGRHRQLPRPAGGGPRRDRRVGRRAVDHEGRLLELRARRGRGVGAGRLVPRRHRHARRSDAAQPDPVVVSARRSRSRRAWPTRTARPPTSSRCRLRASRTLRVLHVPPGHVDGVAARRRRRRPDRRGARRGQRRVAATRSTPTSVADHRAAPRPTTPARPVGSRSTPTRAVRPSSTPSATARPPTTGSTAKASSTPPPRSSRRVTPPDHSSVSRFRPDPAGIG